KGAATTTLTTSAPTVQLNQNLTLTAAVAPAASGLAAVTGSVSFSDSGQLLGTAPIINGRATLTLNTLSAGNHFLSAAYSGDANYTGGTSAAVNQQVAAPMPVTSATTLTS